MNYEAFLLQDWTSDSDNDPKEVVEWESDEEQGAPAAVRPPLPCESAGPSEVIASRCRSFAIGFSVLSPK